MLGVAVIGPGRAGRARIAALEARADARLVATVAREGGPELAQVLADPAVDAVIVCTPNALHAGQAAAALEARKHVAVEFPLAEGPDTARALFARARELDRVLHVEHIELLSGSQARQRERVRELGRPTGGELRFSGRSAGWIGEERLAGSPALRSLARLHRLVDLFGSARVDSASLDAKPDGYTLHVGLEFEQGGRVGLVESRGRDLPRATHWAIDCERGRLDDPGAPPASGLFARDLDCFVARITTDADPYVSEARVVEVLGLVAAIEAACA